MLRLHTKTCSILFIPFVFLISCMEDVAEQPKVKVITQEEYNKLFTEEVNSSILRHTALDSADRKEIPYLKDFLAIYPESVVRYLSFAETDFPGLSVNTTLYKRYQFNMRIPVKYSDDNTNILNYGTPLCHLLEIRSVNSRVDESGEVTLAGTSAGDLQKHFGDKEWQKLCKANGDFSILGYELKQNSPIKNFKFVIKHIKSLERKTNNQ